jgi:predicted negative regulator of RcsB-dependent stress response
MAEDFMTDDEQLDAVKRWTAENGVWLVAGVLLGAAGLFGYRYYESYTNERDLKASAEFAAMTDAVDKNDRPGALRIAERITHDYSRTPYADQAELTLARLYLDQSQPANAIAALTQVMNTSKDADLKLIARLRLARVLTDQGRPDEAISTLAGATPGAFAGLYHEVHGDALFAKKDLAGAMAEYRAALASNDAREADAALLELKIADLGVADAPAANPVPAPTAANPAPAAPAANPVPATPNGKPSPAAATVNPPPAAGPAAATVRTTAAPSVTEANR